MGKVQEGKAREEQAKKRAINSEAAEKSFLVLMTTWSHFLANYFK